MAILRFLKQIELFHKMTESQLQLISQTMVSRQYAMGETIFYEGDRGDMLYIIRSGQVRILTYGLDGSETSVIMFGQAGDIFGELAVIDGLPRSATAVALDDTILLTMSREAFRQHMQRMPQLADNFMRELSRRVRYNTVQINSLVSLPVPQRLARQLIELAQIYGRATPEGVMINISLTQQHLASMVGATRESINKCLRHFRQHNWILVNDGRITILDSHALRSQTAK